MNRYSAPRTEAGRPRRRNISASCWHCSFVGQMTTISCRGTPRRLSLACCGGGSLALLRKALWAVHSFHAAAVPATADLAVAGEHPVGDADDLRGAAVVVIKLDGGNASPVGEFDEAVPDGCR